MATTAMRRPFTVAEYERMGTSGIIAAQERTELIDGEVITMSPIGGRHTECVNLLTHVLGRMLPEGYLLSIQNPVRLTGRNEPQPDIAIIRHRAYGGRVPTAADVLLLIEVSDTTLAYDQEVKLPLYAAASIAEAWVIDLAAVRVERYTAPRDGVYQHVVSAGKGESLASTALPALTVTVDAIT